MTTVTICDSTVGTACTEDAGIRRASILIDNLELCADLCKAHRSELYEALTALGFQTVSKRSENRKKRAVYDAASGAKFSAADARAWLREQGEAEAASGRLSQEHLDRYAAVH